MDFYSHWEPNKILLKEHLQYVGDKSKEVICSKKFDEADKNIISDVSYLVGISHDFGKYTTFFQKKLHGLKDKNDPLTYHGLISALFTFELVNEYIKTKNLKDQQLHMFLPLLAYFVVKHHHGNLDNIENDIRPENLFDTSFKNIKIQLDNIWSNKKQIADEYNSLLSNYHSSTEEIFEKLEKYKKEIKFSKEINTLIGGLEKSLYFFKKKEKGIIYYLLVQLLYSVLIDSDKKHASGVREIERKELSECLVEDYLKQPKFEKENKSNINPIREEIRKSVLKNINSEYKSHKIFTITAPTGTGKTLTSLSAALKLRKLLKKELNLDYEPRIIYSLPFTSIIDQNFDVFDNVLSQIKDFKRYESEYLLKHHYLSDIFYKTKDIDKEEDIDESMALIESWESEIVITTFIQLFYTLIGYKNRSLKKFNNIVNSIILLDEVQNIPIEYWKLVQEILIGMTKYFNCRIILMTATKPLIFDEGTYKELVEDYYSYFKHEELNRVCLKIDSNEMQIAKFCNSLDKWDKNSYLFVFNTINSSSEFYKLIVARIQNLGLSFNIYYLSTNIIPKERIRRIKTIKEFIKNKQKVIIVSTQLIEAGVDIDCGCVYRDMGPLDSIIQVAGRCNRNKRQQQSDVYLLNLISDKNKPFTTIYDSVLLDAVKQILDGQTQIAEVDFLNHINEYFKVTKEKSVSEIKLIDSIYELYFYDKTPDNNKRKPISEFKLIKEAPYKVDVFVEFDEKAKEVMNKYIEIITNEDLISFEKKNKFAKIKKDFYDYVISVSKNKINDSFLPTVDQEFGLNYPIDMYYISDDNLKDYYDKDIGFIVKDNNLL